MKISREIIINGQSQRVDYELTGVELERAYLEYQNQSDKAEVTARLKESGEYERWDEIPDEIISQMAEDFRTEMNTIADTMGDGRIPAMESVFRRHKEDLEEYKEKWKVFSKEVTLTLTHEYTIKAKNKEDADRIFGEWSEQSRNIDQMIEDLIEDARWDGDWDYGYTYEDDSTGFDCVDISEEDV